MTALTLYTTEGCHLCEEAEQILQQLKLECAPDLTINPVEIGDDNKLTAQYGIRIPVLKFGDSSEIDWPFTADDIVQKINNLR